MPSGISFFGGLAEGLGGQIGQYTKYRYDRALADQRAQAELEQIRAQAEAQLQAKQNLETFLMGQRERVLRETGLMGASGGPALAAAQAGGSSGGAAPSYGPAIDPRALSIAEARLGEYGPLSSLTASMANTGADYAAETRKQDLQFGVPGQTDAQLAPATLAEIQAHRGQAAAGYGSANASNAEAAIRKYNLSQTKGADTEYVKRYGETPYLAPLEKDRYAALGEKEETRRKGIQADTEKELRDALTRQRNSAAGLSEEKTNDIIKMRDAKLEQIDATIRDLDDRIRNRDRLTDQQVTYLQDKSKSLIEAINLRQDMQPAVKARVLAQVALYGQQMDAIAAQRGLTEAKTRTVDALRPGQEAVLAATARDKNASADTRDALRPGQVREMDSRTTKNLSAADLSNARKDAVELTSKARADEIAARIDSIQAGIRNGELRTEAEVKLTKARINGMASALSMRKDMDAAEKKVYMKRIEAMDAEISLTQSKIGTQDARTETIDAMRPGQVSLLGEQAETQDASQSLLGARTDTVNALRPGQSRLLDERANTEVANQGLLAERGQTEQARQGEINAQSDRVRNLMAIDSTKLPFELQKLSTETARSMAQGDLATALRLRTEAQTSWVDEMTKASIALKQAGTQEALARVETLKTAMRTQADKAQTALLTQAWSQVLKGKSSRQREDATKLFDATAKSMGLPIGLSWQDTSILGGGSAMPYTRGGVAGVPGTASTALPDTTGGAVAPPLFQAWPGR